MFDGIRNVSYHRLAKESSNQKSKDHVEIDLISSITNSTNQSILVLCCGSQWMRISFGVSSGTF
jgi:hypothetical protein